MRRRSFRRAAAASVFLHAALVVLVASFRTPPPPRPPTLDTSADAVISMHFADEPTVEVAMAAPVPKAEEPVEARPPLAHPTPIPRTLPPELLALLKRPSPAGGAVVDVPVTPTAMVETKPSVAATPVAHAPGSPQTAPIHGALPADKSIVYVLDASGSMGEWGKIAKARRALVATLRQQPPTAKFQIVAYNGTARVLLPDPNGGCVVASPENVRLAEEKLAGVEPVGRSDHVRGLQTAMNLRPDFVLILTDADDLSAAKVRGWWRRRRGRRSCAWRRSGPTAWTRRASGSE